MVTRVGKWGNSLALRIPSEMAAESRLHEGSVVEMRARQGEIRITVPARPRYTLEELLAGVTPRNVHPETCTGRPVGNEAW